MDKEQKNYEISFLAKGDKDNGEIIEALKKHQASITGEDNVLRIKLAYPIKKEESAFFGCLRFSATPDIIKKVSDGLNFNQKILRFLIITPPIAKLTAVSAPRMRRQALFKEAEKKIEIKKPESHQILTNEELEKKLEEILK